MKKESKSSLGKLFLLMESQLMELLLQFKHEKKSRKTTNSLVPFKTEIVETKKE